MLGLEGVVAAGLVPPPARSVFILAWQVSALTQPLAALSFVTDGVHWGTADYRYLRNAMLLATGLGIIVLLGIDPRGPAALTWAGCTYVGLGHDRGLAPVACALRCGAYLAGPGAQPPAHRARLGYRQMAWIRSSQQSANAALDEV